jgi:phosphoribosylamine--glycine ligase
VQTGVPIDGLEATDALRDVFVFHAGTALRDGRVVTSGGRVLTVVGRGSSYAEAIGRAYAGVSAIAFEGMQYRTDIGKKAVRKNPESRIQDPGGNEEYRMQKTE